MLVDSMRKAYCRFPLITRSTPVIDTSLIKSRERFLKNVENEKEKEPKKKKILSFSLSQNNLDR